MSLEIDASPEVSHTETRKNRRRTKPKPKVCLSDTVDTCEEEVEIFNLTINGCSDPFSTPKKCLLQVLDLLLADIEEKVDSPELYKYILLHDGTRTLGAVLNPLSPEGSSVIAKICPYYSKMIAKLAEESDRKIAKMKMDLSECELKLAECQRGAKKTSGEGVSEILKSIGTIAESLGKAYTAQQMQMAQLQYSQVLQHQSQSPTLKLDPDTIKSTAEGLKTIIATLKDLGIVKGEETRTEKKEEKDWEW